MRKILKSLKDIAIYKFGIISPVLHDNLMVQAEYFRSLSESGVRIPPDCGDIYYLTAGTIIPGFEDLAYETPVGSVNFTPLKTNYGYHVIEVLDRYRAGSQIDLDKAYDEIYQIIYNQKKQRRAVALMDSLRNHYNVKIYLENN